MDYFACTENNAGPIIDLVWAGLNGLGALIVASDPDSYENSDYAIGSGAVWAVFSSAAAVTGFGKTKRCRIARQELAERQVLCDFRPEVGLRLGPHFFNTEEELDFAIGQVKDILATGAHERHLGAAARF